MVYLLPIISFAFVMSITPGPNNIMLWASGANYGFRRTVPHMLGINLGFGSLVLLCGLGLGVLFEAFPLFQTFLKVAGSLYLLYLAYRIATASFGGAAKVARPSFRHARFPARRPLTGASRIRGPGSAPAFGTNFCVRPFWLSEPYRLPSESTANECISRNRVGPSVGKCHV